MYILVSDCSHRLRSIKREIVDKETKVTEKQKTREEEERDSAFQTKRLGKYVYPL